MVRVDYNTADEQPRFAWARLGALGHLLESLIPLVILGTGIFAIIQQHRQLATWHPVWAAQIPVGPFLPDGTSAFHTYRYEVDGRRITLWHSKTDRVDWARSQPTTAPTRLVEIHYNPARPHQAMVGRGLRFWPYSLFLVGLTVLAVASPLISGNLIDTLAPANPARTRARFEWLTALFILAAGTTALLDFHHPRPFPHDPSESGWYIAFTATCILAIMWPIWHTIRSQSD